MTFFFDRSIGRRVPDALKLLGADVVKHDDLFEQTTPDDRWLVAAAQNGWTVITRDKCIRFNEAERRAILRPPTGHGQPAPLAQNLGAR